MDKIEKLKLSLRQLTPFELELKKWYLSHGSLMPNDFFLKRSGQMQELNRELPNSTANLDATYRNFGDAQYDSSKKIADLGSNFLPYLDVPFLILKHPRYFPPMVYETRQVNITYIYSGHCQTHVFNAGKEEIIALEDGDFMFNPSANQLAHHVADDDSIVLNMVMTDTLFRRMISNAFPNGVLVEFYTRYVCNNNRGPALIFHTKTDAFIRSLIEQILLDGNETGQIFSEVTYLSISLMLAYMQREYGRNLELINVKKSLHHIPAMVAYIQEHYQSFDSKLMAEYFHLSPTYLSRLFHQQTGHTLNEIVRDTRIKAAQNFLQYTDNPVIDIAEKVGYTDISYFIEIFRKKTGMTPLQYRKNMLRHTAFPHPQQISFTDS